MPSVAPLPFPPGTILLTQEALRRYTMSVVDALAGRTYTDITLAGSLAFTEAPTLTIAAGVIDLRRTEGPNVASVGAVAVDTQAAAATDDLDTINGGRDGMLLFLRAFSDTHTVVIKNGTGNIVLASDIALDTYSRVVPVIYNGILAKWIGLPMDYSRGGAAANVADGGTITHGLPGTPTNVQLTGSVAGEIVTATTLGATTITVAIKKPGASQSAGTHDHPTPVGDAGSHTHDQAAGTTQTIYWRAWL